MHRTALRAVALTVISALALAACGSGDQGLDSVKVSKGAVPSVTVEPGYTTASTTTRVVAEGSGEELESGDTVKVNYVAVNGRTGKQFDNSFKANTPLTAPLRDKAILPGFIKGLTGQKIGTRLLVGIPPKDGFDSAQKALGLQKDDSMVFLFDVVGKVATEADGAKQKLPAEAPRITLTDGEPSGFTTSGTTLDKPSKPVSYTAIKGDGKAVKANQNVTVQYVGQIFPKGKVFDSSWKNGSPLSQPLSGLIKCWQDELPGKTLGSRVILVCPPSSAYAGTQNELKDDTLVFAIDLLDAS